MTKSRAEMMVLVGKLLAECPEFQRRRPDLPQGDLMDLSEVDLEILVAVFQHDRGSDAEQTDPTPAKPWLH